MARTRLAADLSDEHVVVTGATSGIGRGVALRLSQLGARVVVAGRNGQVAAEVADEIVAGGGVALAVPTDVRDEDSIAKLFETATEAFGTPTGLVASAGISGGSDPVIDYPYDRWQSVIDTNLNGVFLSCREAMRRMVPAQRGHIVVVSSQAGVHGYATKGAYGASKFGARGLAHVLAEEGRHHGVSVSALCPGTVLTPILAATNDGSIKYPLSVDVVVDAVLYLLTLGPNALIRDLVLERQQTR